ncbi:hypothetical protein J6590_035021 [Homalodisca vitripennis]|nr:hypothetical protein J6590_035021 [Homalodisca vitripennis]
MAESHILNSVLMITTQPTQVLIEDSHPKEVLSKLPVPCSKPCYDSITTPPVVSQKQPSGKRV